MKSNYFKSLIVGRQRAGGAIPGQSTEDFRRGGDSGGVAGLGIRSNHALHSRGGLVLRKIGGPQHSTQSAILAIVQKQSSFPNSGDSGPDFEEEVGIVAEVVGDALDDLDLIVDAFDQVRP
jgi:hypothetical protein